MSEKSSIIKTKVLVPAKRPDLLHRSRLVDFIHEHIDRKLILVSAAAGYGKTSLLTDYAHDTDLPVCWYSLDEWDRDPRVFMENLVASIRERFPRFGGKTLGALEGGIMVEGMRSIVGTTVNEMYEVIPDYFALVVDDFHLISEAEAVTTLFSLLLRHLPENCHILLASRTTTPGLPIVELMARQQMAGLGNEDLRFTASEIRQLLEQNYSLDLPAEEAERLAEESEGWITAVLLTTHNLWDGLLRTMTRSRGDDSKIFAYLAQEVLQQQNEEVQSFLKSSSVLERMNPALCNELLGIDNSQEMLAHLEDENLFVSRLEGDGGDWFRYHQLFQEFLRVKLREEGDRWISLHLKAGGLFEGQESWDEAIRHYLQAKAYLQAARLVEESAPWAFESGRWSSLLSWIDSLAGRASLSPWILYWQSRVLANFGRLDDAVQALGEARDRFSERGERSGIVRALLQEGYIHRLRAEYADAIARTKEALSILQLSREEGLVASARRTLGVCYGLLGRVEEGLTELEKALRAFERLGEEHQYDVADTLHDIGTIYYSMDIEKYLHYSRKALALWRRLGARDSLAMTLNNIGVAQYRQGRFDEGLQTLQEALQESQALGSLRPQAYAKATIGDVYRARGDYGLAQQAYEQALGLAELAGEGFLVSYLWDALGNVERALGNHEKAGELVSQAIEEAYEHGSDYQVAVARISQGILLHVRGRDDEALKPLQRAVSSLRDMGVKQELAKGYFHLGGVLFAQEQPGQAMLNLEMALDILAEAGFDPLLLDDGTGSRSLLLYALGEASLREQKGLLHKLLSRTEPPGESIQLVEPELPRLEFCALGPSRLRRDGEPVEAEELRLGAREMLFFFLAHSAVTKEQIVAALWPDLSLARAHSTFHFYLFQVRRLLGGSASISYEGGVYRLESRGYQYDVEEFQRALAKAAKAGGGRREAYLRRAVSLYQGDYLEDVYSDWTDEPRASLKRDYFRTLEGLATYHVQEGRLEEAVEFYRSLLDKEPLREDAHRQVMRCLVQMGDRAGAMKQFEDLRRLLVQELQVEPSAETIEVYEDLMTDSA